MNSTNQPDKCQLSKENAEIQRFRLLERLQKGPISTFEARSELFIAHPAGRIFDLREQGHKIETHTCEKSTTAGAVSRVALYVLVEE